MDYDQDYLQALADQKEADERNSKRNMVAMIGDALGSMTSASSIAAGVQPKQSTMLQSMAEGMAKHDNPLERYKSTLANYKLAQEGKALKMKELAEQAKRDPNSLASQQARTMFEKLGGKVTGAESEADLDEPLKYGLKMRELDDKSQDRQAMYSYRNAVLGQRDDEHRRAEEAKAKEKEDKKRQAVTEVEDRRRNIEDNLALVEQMIKENGTYEMFGSHNADLDRRVDAIATDMAKLADPTSVARPSEVEQFKKGLVKSSATDMRNSTALDILNNFKKEVAARADNAYRVRGLENPAGKRTEAPVFEQDVIDYARTHGISPEQAQKIKQQRTGS